MYIGMKLKLYSGGANRFISGWNFNFGGLARTDLYRDGIETLQDRSAPLYIGMKVNLHGVGAHRVVSG